MIIEEEGFSVRRFKQERGEKEEVEGQYVVCFQLKFLWEKGYVEKE